MGLRRFSDLSGGLTPQEFYQQNSFPSDARCLECRSKRVNMRAIVFWPLKECVSDGLCTEKQVPLLQDRLIQLRDPKTGTVSWFVRYKTIYSCRQCQPRLEQELAHIKSYVVVDITRGPDPTNRVTVGRSQGVH